MLYELSGREHSFEHLVRLNSLEKRMAFPGRRKFLRRSFVRLLGRLVTYKNDILKCWRQIKARNPGRIFFLLV